MWKMLTVAVAAVIGWLGGAGVQSLLPQSPDVRELLVVGEKSGALLAIIDPAALEIVARVAANPNPHEVATDGRHAYVSNSGARAITVIDLVTREQVKGIDLGPLGAVHGLWFAAGKLYFANEGTRIIGRYDPAARRIEWVLGTGRPQSHMIVTSRDGNRIFTTETGPGTATLFQRDVRPGVEGAAATGGDWVMRVIPTGPGAEGLDLSPDERELWVANVRDRTLSVIDVAAAEVVHTIQLPTTYANRLKFTPDGRHVLVADLRGREVIVYDAVARREVRRIDVGGGSEGMQMTPDGRRAFVAVSAMNKVAVVDLASFSVIAEISGLNNPDGMSWVRPGGAR
jgi:YVTN family beta-propeller protein